MLGLLPSQRQLLPVRPHHHHDTSMLGRQPDGWWLEEDDDAGAVVCVRSLRPVAAVSSVLEALSARHGLGQQEGGGGLVVGVHVRQIALSHDTPEVEFAGR